MKRNIIAVLIISLFSVTFLLTACGGGGEKTDYEHLRDVSWEGTELTIKLGENKSTGCEWTTRPEDDSVIDYSVNRVFHMADDELADGNAVGTLEAGFQGKGAGTSRIICTTPVGWDGTGDGLAYIVTVTVNEDGTIESAEGVESDAASVGEKEDSAAGEKTTIEDYFAENPDELESMKESINSDESMKEMVDVDVKVKGNTISYIYTFKETYSDEQIDGFKPDLKKNMEGEVTDSMQDYIASIKEEFGVDDAKLYMEYRNGDGTKILGTTIE